MADIFPFFIRELATRIFNPGAPSVANRLNLLRVILTPLSAIFYAMLFIVVVPLSGPTVDLFFIFGYPLLTVFRIPFFPVLLESLDLFLVLLSILSITLLCSFGVSLAACGVTLSTLPVQTIRTPSLLGKRLSYLMLLTGGTSLVRNTVDIFDSHSGLPKNGDLRRLAVLLSKQHPLNLWRSRINKKSAQLGIAASIRDIIPQMTTEGNYSDPGDSWLDPFLGSGTTVCAAHNEGRQGLGIEQLEKYVSVTLERLAGLTNQQPELINST